MTPLTRKLLFVGWTFVSVIFGILIALLLRPARVTARILISGDPPMATPESKDIFSKTYDVVNWYGPPGSKIGITFKAADFDPNSTQNVLKEPPFEGGTAGVDQPINCGGSSCTSLNINPVLVAYLREHPTAKFTYKYWQFLDGKSKDGKIIIKW